MIRVGIIGYGYWGPNLVRVFHETPGMAVAWVSDLRADRLAQVTARYPGVRTTTDCGPLFDDPDLDVVAIATSVSTHFPLALRALQAGKHVWVEKPLTAKSPEAETLIEEAARRGLVLFVDHTFVYTGAVRKMTEVVKSGALGELYYYDSVRVNLGLFQHDVNVNWDLAVHDLAILDHVFPKKPVALTAVGTSHLQNQLENVAYITLFYSGHEIAHVHVNWLAPVKVRRTLLGGSNRMIVYDDLEPSEKIKIYDKGADLAQSPQSRAELLVSYRSGDMWAPRIDNAEALKTAALHFLDCILNRKTPVTDGRCGLRIVRLLEAADASMQARGALVEISFPEFHA